MGLGTDCSTTNCSTGACCIGTTCTTSTESLCTCAKCTYQGDGTACDDVPAPCATPTGACCNYNNSSCTITTQANCSQGGGIYQGNYEDCDQCTGACCLSGNQCNQLTEEDCDGFGGQFQGLCQTNCCEGDPCGDEGTGSCCCEFSDGMWSCIEGYTETGCSNVCAFDYTWIEGGSCSANSCGAPTGACCLSTSVCLDNPPYTWSNCQSAGGGTWNVDELCKNTECSPSTTGRCCYGEGVCQTDKTEAECVACLGAYDSNNSCTGDPCTNRPSCCNPITSECNDIWTCCKGLQTVDDCATGCVDDSYACCEKVGGIYTGNCSDLEPAQCKKNGGQPLTSHDDCISSPCGLGVCCYDDGGTPSCIRTIEYECATLGKWMGAGICADFSDNAQCADQTVPTGACCLAGKCIDLLSFDVCETKYGGDYQEDNSDCFVGPIDCGTPPDCVVCSGSPFRGNDFEDQNTYIKLPSGQCVWMNCFPPNCPYPSCG